MQLYWPHTPRKCRIRGYSLHSAWLAHCAQIRQNQAAKWLQVCERVIQTVVLQARHFPLYNNSTWDFSGHCYRIWWRDDLQSSFIELGSSGRSDKSDCIVPDNVQVICDGDPIHHSGQNRLDVWGVVRGVCSYSYTVYFKEHFSVHQESSERSHYNYSEAADRFGHSHAICGNHTDRALWIGAECRGL